DDVCRATIEDVEGDVGELDAIFQLVKLCIGMIDAGRAYSQANRHFVNGVRELALQSTRDDVIGSSLAAFAETLQEMNNYHTILFDQAQRSIKSQLHTFVKEDLKKFKDAKKQFDKVSEEKEVALVKNAQVPRNKQHEVDEATNILTTTRKCFRHIALDYGYHLFSDLQPLMKQLGGQDFSTDDTKLEYNIDTENGIAMEGYLFKRASNAFKTWNRRWFSIQNSQLVYQKRFRDNPTVVVEDLRLCTVKQCEDVERRFCFEVVSPTKSCMLQADSEKLRQAWTKAVQNSIATAYRENGDEPVPLDRQASVSVGSLDSLGEGRGLRAESALQRVLAVSGNDRCCDCGQTEPRWASINLGITLCIECSGIHRSLGVHNSKVRSLTLDSWEPELLKLMCELGNGVINQIYEARRAEMGWRKPQPGDPRQEIEAYIRAKYVEKKFVQRPGTQEQRSKVMALSKHDKRLKGSVEFLPPRPPPPTPKLRTASSTSGLQEESPVSLPQRDPPPVFSELTELCPSLLLYWASCASSLPDMAEAFALGADANWVNMEDQSRTPLMQAVQGGSLVTCEFLLQNAANVDQSDARGRAALHHATILGHTGQVCLFLKRGARQGAVDVDGRTPLSIAVEAANADIVTLLRLAKMNEELKESEGPLGQPGQYVHSQSNTEQQYKKCIQEFISQQLDES
uniref:Arf-GAP with coiled-coil, ANK repeat and PH domain-containing protein n=1 Tax=Pygocentrus nattereri TaxID=42514 RepID=A0A3B4DFA7_PYGNA